jgi:hypothetical protein
MGKYESINDILLDLGVLDGLCAKNGTTAKLMLFGASAILFQLELINIPFRATEDIDLSIYEASDVSAISKNIQASLIELVSSGTIEVPPVEDFDDMEKFRIEWAFENIEVYVPSLEILAVTKIFSKRGKDLDDLKKSQLIPSCNKEKLLELVNEYKDYVLGVDHFDMNLYELNDIFKLHGV